MRISPHFTLEELTKTNVKSLRLLNSTPPERLMPAAKALCEDMLEPVREHFGAPLIINSAYRCPALNQVVGGSKTSQHLKFEAADFYILGKDLETVWRWICYDSGLKFGQCILEGNSIKPTWIHLSLGPPWRPANISGQRMKFDGKRYTSY